MKGDDYLYRFVFEQLGVRGEFVRLGDSWQAVRERHDYPHQVEYQLGSALAAVMLLSGTIKFNGSLVLQLQGDSMLRSLVAQATDQRTLRGMAVWDDAVTAGDDAAEVLAMSTLFGRGRMVLTAEALSGERYQGIVGIEGERLADVVDNYFQQSEQLPSRIWLAADQRAAAGLFLQRLPGGDAEDDSWRRVGLLADTLSDEELLTLEPEILLHRLFSEDDLRIFEPEPVSFHCGCSRERIGRALRGLGQADVEHLLHEQGRVEAGCEFCNAHYTFDEVDIALLFNAAAAEGPDAVQ